MATNIDLESFVRGDTWTNKFVVVDAAGDPIDITGWTLWVTLKLDPTVADVDADLQSSEVIVASGDATGGIGYVVSAPADTALLIPATYNYDMQYVTGSGEVQTMAYGTVPVVRDMTVSVA